MEEQNVKAVLWREALDWLKWIVFALIFAWFVANFVIVNAVVPTGSMENTIRERDRIIAFRLSYLFSEPSRNDIVIFRSPYIEGRLYVKRIIGLPGETVVIRDGRVFIDGADEPLPDEFVYGGFTGNFGPFPAEGVIPEDSFFVLGDYRNNSWDSRQWSDPFVTGEQILGRVIFRYFPGVANLMR